MPSLVELQFSMRAALVADNADYEPLAATLGSHLATSGVDPRECLRIYRHNVRSSLTEALKATYPVVCRIVDERFFGYAADAYINEERPAGPCLHEYGRRFPAFLASFPPCESVPYLADVAHFEWALSQSLNAENECSIDTNLLAGLAPQTDRFRLRLAKSSFRSSYEWPVDEIWTAHQHREVPELGITRGDVRLEIWRANHEVLFRRLSPAEYEFHCEIASGQSLSEAAAIAHAIDPLFDLTLALRRIFRQGIVVGFTLMANRSPQEKLQ